MKQHPPLRMAFAVLVLYAFLAVFFVDGNRRPPAVVEPSLIARNPVPASPSPADGTTVPAQVLPESGQLRTASPASAASAR